MKIIIAKRIKVDNNIIMREFEGDIYNYFDVEWPDATWMQYKEGFVVLNQADGKIYYIELV